jgi:hypothetical protein
VEFLHSDLDRLVQGRRRADDAFAASWIQLGEMIRRMLSSNLEIRLHIRCSGRAVNTGRCAADNDRAEIAPD